MRFYEASSTITATPSDVWSVLVDGSAWPLWDSGVDAVQGVIAAGQTVTIKSQAAPGRSFPVKVTVFEPAQRLQFSGGMPLGLFKGVRTYTLTLGTGATTSFAMREEYSGPMVGLIWRSMPDLGPSFRQFADGLKQRVEAGR